MCYKSLVVFAAMDSPFKCRLRSKNFKSQGLKNERADPKNISFTLVKISPHGQEIFRTLRLLTKNVKWTVSRELCKKQYPPYILLDIPFQCIRVYLYLFIDSDMQNRMNGKGACFPQYVENANPK